MMTFNICADTGMNLMRYAKTALSYWKLKEFFQFYNSALLILSDCMKENELHLLFKVKYEQGSRVYFRFE